MKLRKAIESDLDNVLLLHQKLFTYNYDYQHYANELDNEFSHFLVLENDNQIVGYFIIHVIFENIDIIIIAIDEKIQNLGYGQLLFDYILYIKDKHKCDTIMLEVETSNIKAINFYQKNNFEIIQIRKNYYGNNQDALVMKRG